MVDRGEEAGRPPRIDEVKACSDRTLSSSKFPNFLLVDNYIVL